MFAGQAQNNTSIEGLAKTSGPKQKFDHHCLSYALFVSTRYSWDEFQADPKGHTH